MQILFTKTREVKTPERGTKGSAGYDFFVPIDQSTLEIPPHKTITIPSGIKTVLPKNTVLIAMNKSGVASKEGLDVMACVIDEDYRGEIHLSVCNTTPNTQYITAGKKLVQMIHQEYIGNELKEISNDEYEKFANTERGEGKFGSTGDK